MKNNCKNLTSLPHIAPFAICHIQNHQEGKAKPVANIASTWPFKSNFKPNIKSNILAKRPLDDQTSCAADLHFALTIAKMHIRKRFSEFETHVWHKNTKISTLNRTHCQHLHFYYIMCSLWFAENQWKRIVLHIPNDFLRSRKHVSEFALIPR